MKLTLRTFAACAAAAAVLGGCGGGSGGGEAEVRLVNATSAYPSLDLYDSATLLTSGVTPYTAGGYAPLAAGTYTLNLEATGATAVLASTSQLVASDSHYAMVSYVSNGSLQTVAIGEDQAVPAAGTAALRVWDTAYNNVGTLDAYVVTTDCSALGTTSGAPLVSALTVTGGFIDVTATVTGTPYHICVTAAGDKSDLRLDIPSVTFTSQQVATLLLTNTTGGTLLNGLLLTQQGAATPELNTSARVRLAVGTTGTSDVTAIVNGTTLGSALVAPAVGGYKLVTAGPLATSISINGASVADPGFTAAAGADLTLLVNGTVASTPVLIPDDNSVSDSATNAVKIRLVNGLNGTTGAATLTDDYVNVGDGAATGSATTYLQVPPSAGLGRVEADNGTAPLCLSTGVTLTTGHVYSVFVLGDVPATAGACNIRLDR